MKIHEIDFSIYMDYGHFISEIYRLFKIFNKLDICELDIFKIDYIAHKIYY